MPAADAAVVRRLREAGFVVLGKTNTPELGTIAQTESELNGACRNPWDTDLTPGGSSGGAAAAVAAGPRTGGPRERRWRLDQDTRLLLRPRRDQAVPRTRLAGAYGPGPIGFSTSGPLARTVRDAAALLDAMAGPEPGDPFVAPAPERPFLAEADEAPGRLRVALTVEPPVEVPVDPECAAAARSAADLLAELGHDVVEATPPWQSDEMLVHFIRVWQVFPAIAGVEDLSLLEPINRALAEDALATPSPAFAAAVYVLQAEARRIVRFWEEADVVLTPTLALQPVPIGWTFEETDGDARLAFARQTLFTPFTPLVNVTGQPAVSLPLHWSEAGAPIGVQLIGAPFADATLDAPGRAGRAGAAVARSQGSDLVTWDARSTTVGP